MPVLDCRKVADGFLDWVKEARTGLASNPCLATVLCGPSADAGSRQYRDLILRDAAKLGLKSLSVQAADQSELLQAIGRLNEDAKVTGVMVLYPIGGSLADEDIMDLVSPRKDVEGLHSVNLGYLIKFKRFLDEARGIKCVVPATAKAVVKTLQHYSVPIDGSFVAVVNNSMRVGKPLSLMLENLGATVVTCYRKTRPRDLEAAVRIADIVVTAVPGAGFRLAPSWIKPGAAVIDVSYQGNFDVDAVSARAGLFTSPDNRIGQVTRAMMFVNLIYCAQSAAGAQAKAAGAGPRGSARSR
ncbi:MAG: bifunctional 5,10-methylenetetrahydrofolate dehydrogenase/5,10-methenyltetrahydrofolate cyclohydrolase [Elusimicrobia bacterium]|nr:bifunctional 5,10-methylenetetrahydrofolate dehydrogenase/5,10-methenyltetrahydrofolate cyclohydrolase [Elusimicrobiota bacterium]